MRQLSLLQCVFACLLMIIGLNLAWACGVVSVGVNPSLSRDSVFAGSCRDQAESANDTPVDVIGDHGAVAVHATGVSARAPC